MKRVGLRSVWFALLGSALVVGGAAEVFATPFTTTSPVDGGTALPGGVTEVGGIVVDGIGFNTNRLTSQLAASSLYIGFADDGTPIASRGNPLTIGTQTGLTPAITSGLGGGLSELAVRFTLYDGDTAPFNFDDGDNTLLINGVNVGDWSSVTTQETSSDGLTSFSSGTGFGDETLSTGFFHVTNAGLLATIYSSMITNESLVFQLLDTDPFDNYFDFTQGIDGSLIDVETPPVVTPSVPEPSSLVLLGLGTLGLFIARRRRKIKVR